jgi:hypothetical protein
MAALTKLGELTIVEAADLADVDHTINLRGDARVGSTGVGKRAGMLVLVKQGTDDYDIALALGEGATAKWIVFERGATVTPS